MFDFFFQGAPTGNSLPDGFPRFATPRDCACARPAAVNGAAGVFKPFENSWLGGLPGGLAPLPPEMCAPRMPDWIGIRYPEAVSQKWSPNEEASNHLKKMLRIVDNKTQSIDKAVGNIVRDPKLAPLNNAGTQDRGDPYAMCVGVPPGLSRGFQSNCALNEKANALHARTSYREEVPQRLRRSDSEEDFGNYFPSSRVFDSSLEL